MNAAAITALLLSKGQDLFDAPRGVSEFTGIREADELLNDLDEHPHAFVLACVMDRQMEAKKVWEIPFRIADKLGDFRFATLAALSLDQVKELMTRPKPLHRFPKIMSENVHAAIGLIGRKYSGDVARIWSGKPTSADVVQRFREFKGVGPKIASMAVNLLAREFKIPFSDYSAIDISADVQVVRVFKRLGLIRADDSNEAVIYRARALHPAFPGLFDSPAWEIGVNYCRPQNPSCGRCYLASLCPSRVAERGAERQ